MNTAPASLLTLSHEELSAWLRLALTPGVGNASARRLLTAFGSPQTIFTQSANALQACVSAAQATALCQLPADCTAAIATTWQWLHAGTAELGHALITLGDPRYPSALLQTEDPPLMLYVLGPAAWLQQPIPLLDSSCALAIVGSRNPTAQGAENARSFAHHLAQQGWCVVSGLAAGVDAAAHSGALQAVIETIEVNHSPAISPRTIAVVGTGVDRVYPRQNQALARQIVQHGFIVSEYPLGTPPIAANFPKRNRLIAGLSAGTLVVEAAVASGSLITARLAAEQGREVFAIPGSIHAPQSKGCHALLRQGAKLVESVQDILEELPVAPLALAKPPATSATPEVSSMQAPPLTATPPMQQAVLPLPQAAPVSPASEHPVLLALGYDPMGFDQLQARTGWNTAALQAWLLEQELDGVVARLPGGLFQRVVRG